MGMALTTSDEPRAHGADKGSANVAESHGTRHAWRVPYREASPPAFDLAAGVRRVEVPWIDLVMRRSGWRVYRIEHGAKVLERSTTDPEPYRLSEQELAILSSLSEIGASPDALVLVYEDWSRSFDAPGSG